MKCRAGIACALVSLLCGGVARALPPQRVTESARAVLSHRAYQTELPSAEGQADTAAGSTRSHGRRASDGLGRGDDDRGVPSAPALDSSILLWGVLAVTVILFGASIVADRRRTRTPVIPVEPSPSPPRGAPRPDVDALAAAGRFAEAIHVLFLDLLAGTAAARSPSLTSRELLSRASVGAEVRRALAFLVSSVERTYFGGATASRGDYEACLAEYRVLRSSWG